MSYSKKLVEQREAALEKADAIVKLAQSEERNLTEEEDAEIETSLTEVRSLDDQIKRHSELEARSRDAAEVRSENGIDKAVAVVKSEPRTYTKQASHSFISDAYNAQFNNDFSAKERLARHMQEESVERRDVGTGAFTGLVVPQYLTELAAPFARAGRPVADIARKHQLPESGMTINISRITTGSAVAVQTEGSAVQETNMDDTLLTINVKTIAGQQNVSRQALERGTGIDSIIAADLVSAYHTKLDAELLTQMNTDITEVITYTDASPTVPELYPKLLDAVQRIQTLYFGGPNVIVMHPRRLAWILAALDSTNRPLAVPTPQGPQNNFASGNTGVVYGNSGYSIAGFPVVTDANVITNNGTGTNEDLIYIGNTQELHLWEQGSGEPMMLRFEEPKSAELEVKMVVYSYSAFTAGRYPKSWAIIGGTGLVTPTF
jgi:HK97 family phage major capsid protein